MANDGVVYESAFFRAADQTRGPENENARAANATLRNDHGRQIEKLNKRSIGQKACQRQDFTVSNKGERYKSRSRGAAETDRQSPSNFWDEIGAPFMSQDWQALSNGCFSTLGIYDVE